MFSHSTSDPTRIESMSIGVEVLQAGLLACAAAATIIPLNLGLLMLWVCLTCKVFRERRRRRHRKHAAIGLACSVMTVSFVLVGAARYKPTKTVENFLYQDVSLEFPQMSLAELDDYSRWHREEFPIRVHWTFADADKDIVVTWASPSPTLREFIDNVESQTQLRHRFEHCGNGWSLLHGGDCSFGLSFRDPELTGPPPRRKRVYDSDSYVPPNRDP
jgi:hypothetical protein